VGSRGADLRAPRLGLVASTERPQAGLSLRAQKGPSGRISRR